MWICFFHDTSLIQGQLILIFWGGRFSTYFRNQNIDLKKRAVKAAKSNCLSSRHVKIPDSKDLLIKMPQNWVKCKSTKAITEQCFSCQKRSVPKISLILQKMKIKKRCARKPSIIIIFILGENKLIVSLSWWSSIF